MEVSLKTRGSASDAVLDLMFLIKSMNTTGGGAERVLADVTRELANRGHRITAVTYDKPGQPSFYPLDPRVELIQLGIGNPRSSARWGETLRRIATLRSVLLKRRPQVLVGFMHSVYVPLAAANIGTGIPIIASEHIIWPYYRSRPLQRALLRMITPRAHAFTIPTAIVGRSFPSSIRSKMSVLPNPIALTSGDASADPAGSRTLMTVGRLEPQKDQRTLIRAFGKLAAEFPDWNLRILGEGELRPMLEQEVAALGLGSRISLPGATSNVTAAYAEAGIFVIPSTFESFGLVTGEALAMGLPAVGFADCPGTNEMIEDGENGLLVSGEDRVDALAAGLARLMRSPELRVRMGASGPRSIARFAIGPIVDRWERLLQEARDSR